MAPDVSHSAGPAAVDRSTSLDGWLLDRLFGRR
jgi:hypothetical protein